MLKKYHCLIVPNLTDRHFSFFTDNMISHNLKRDRILNKWFYFYINEPVQPVIIWIGKDSVRLEPGTNRYVGNALRSRNTPIPGIAIVDDSATIPESIQLLDYIEESNLAFDISGKLDATSNICKWAIGSATTLNSNDWYKPAFQWIRENLKYTWALEYKGQKYFLNQRKRLFVFPSKPKSIVKVENYDSFEDAVIDLFNQVCLYEGVL